LAALDCQRLRAAPRSAQRTAETPASDCRIEGSRAWCVEGHRDGLFRDHIRRPRRRPRHLADQAVTLSIEEEKGRLHWQPAPTSS
jgi:hypothetical protein